MRKWLIRLTTMKPVTMSETICSAGFNHITSFINGLYYTYSTFTFMFEFNEVVF